MLRVISLGAGVQSSTMALMADRGLFGERPDLAIFADTGNEPRAVYDWLEWLRANLSFPITILGGKNLMLDSERLIMSKSGRQYWLSLVPYFTRNPDGSGGMQRRKCTSNYKIRPIIKELRRLVTQDKIREWRRSAGVGPLAQSWIGISTDEATRMKPSRDLWIEHRWPLLDAGMSRQDCLDWMARERLPTPPRSACTFCPYHSNAEWLALKRDDPTAFAEAVAHERNVQAIGRSDVKALGVPFLHPSRKPLDSINFENRKLEDGQQSIVDWFQNECEGMCGV